MVTVLMPVYNGARYLQEAVESIRNQTFRDYEFLIIDDGSTDCSAEIVRSYDDKRIVFQSNEENIGINSTLNKGILMARGKYIARMDCDDISLPGRLERQVGFMEGRPEVAVCGTWFEHFGNINGTARPLAEEHEEIRCRLLFGNALAHPTVMMRKDMIVEKNLLYDPSFDAAQDYDLWVRVSRNFRLANIPEVLLRYRTHDLQISRDRAGVQRKAASAVRTRQLRDLLPDVTGAETALFDSVAEKTLPGKAVLLDSVRLLFEKMIEANESRKIYNQVILCDALFIIWWRLCALCSVDGLDAWRIYCKSSIRAGRVDGLKLLLKCIMRYGK